MNELLDDIPYGIIVCKEDGGMLYSNEVVSKLFNCDLKTDTDYNVLSLIDTSFKEKVIDLLSSIRNNTNACNFLYLKIKNYKDKFYKVVAKKSDQNKDNIILMIYDYTPIKIQQDSLTESYNQMSDNLIRNALVLKVISHICNNVLYKDRSTLSEIVTELAYAFHLQKAAICFKNGTGHVVYANRKKDNTYDVGKREGDFVKSRCPIWKNEINYINCTQLIFKVPVGISCWETNEQNETVNILKLKLDSQKVIGFFEFVEDSNFKLSNAELEILESLSQLLAYIVNNKEQVTESTNYIKEKFKSLTVTL